MNCSQHGMAAANKLLNSLQTSKLTYFHSELSRYFTEHAKTQPNYFLQTFLHLKDQLHLTYSESAGP